MSLDVYLTVKGACIAPRGDRIFVRIDGSVKEFTRAEWDEQYPGRDPYSVADDEPSDEVYSANITHNLTRMAEAAGLYDPLWRPEEVGIERARQLIEPLREGITRLLADPPRFRELNPENGWGDYDGLVIFAQDYLAACLSHPEAKVSIWR